jgi:hypothetical protein
VLNVSSKLKHKVDVRNLPDLMRIGVLLLSPTS